MSQTFIKKRENFVCGHCGEFVEGTGYTNHCHKCLWSCHVDNNPGDRANTCGGLMAPIGYVVKQTGYTVIHCCQKCGERKSNKIGPHDDLAVLGAL